MTLETSPIVEFTEHGLRTADGVEHEVDTVIYGTGFHAADYLRSLDVYGTGGRRLRDDWRDGAEAYLGTVVPGYPNLFTLYGPNTNGVTSIIYILEAQAEFVRRILDEWPTRGCGPSTSSATSTTPTTPRSSGRWRAPSGSPTATTTTATRTGRWSPSSPTAEPPSSRCWRGYNWTNSTCHPAVGREGSHRVSGIHHTAIVTADVEASMRFWRDGLGFTELFDYTFTGDWPTLFGAATDQLRSIFLGDPDTPDTGIVELVVFEGDSAGAGACRRSGVRLLPAVAAARRRRHPRHARRPRLRRRGASHRDARAGREEGGHGGDHRAGRCPRRTDRPAGMTARWRPRVRIAARDERGPERLAAEA